jgi:hypothetical protein
VVTSFSSDLSQFIWSSFILGYPARYGVPMGLILREVDQLHNVSTSPVRMRDEYLAVSEALTIRGIELQDGLA